MTPKKKSEYAVPELKDFSAAALDKAAEKLLTALDKEAAETKTGVDWKSLRDRWMAQERCPDSSQ